MPASRTLTVLAGNPRLVASLSTISATMLVPSRRSGSSNGFTSSSAQARDRKRSEEHTSELQSPDHLVCRLLLEKKKDHRDRSITAHVNPRPPQRHRSIAYPRGLQSTRRLHTQACS